MINVTELKPGETFKDKEGIFEVVSYTHKKIGRGSANIRVKARNLRTGNLSEKSFNSGAKVEEADTEKRKLQFLYSDNESAIFMDPKSFDQLPIRNNVLSGKENFLKEGEIYEVLVLEGSVLNVLFPNLVNLKVTEAGPGVKGDTVSSVYKPATLENGLTIKVPMFIKTGDVIKIDTRTKEYVEREKK